MIFEVEDVITYKRGGWERGLFGERDFISGED